jgi:hypothetical protein
VNQDGVVDSFDVTTFIAGWLTSGWSSDFAKYTHGDLNLDGVTNLSDAFVLHRALQNTAAGGFPFEQLSEVPEPGGAMFLAAVLMIICTRGVSRNCFLRR